MTFLARLIFLVLMAVATYAPCEAGIEHERAGATAFSTERLVISEMRPNAALHAKDRSAQANPHCDSAKLSFPSSDFSVGRQIASPHFPQSSANWRGVSAAVDTEPPRASL